MADDQDRKKPDAKGQARQERLAQKLRENLGRRKAQSRDRAAAPEAPDDKTRD